MEYDKQEAHLLFW